MCLLAAAVQQENGRWSFLRGGLRGAGPAKTLSETIGCFCTVPHARLQTAVGCDRHTCIPTHLPTQTHTQACSLTVPEAGPAK
ncbi:hypothetical protein BO78DRAFT_399643 [Aspergillus sclerotiicarbonarius CBS 121057]|uniref:Uncharacterized protein n=1 Tax=Aspergillus sclerotiicarbonarius (strain CBS 121057 / IBT 28362) TaxID=1448318 RepID=A0A319E0V9_ASPSB|nr:hypothetical protein BO78DRAFT_399643 [Aspergillus sclerotiicarbonarius CBS 121057]